MNRQGFESWGRYPVTREEVVRVSSRNDPLPRVPDNCHSMLPFGNGRSYGDVCLNDGGALIETRTALDHFIDFDGETGLLSCESGVLLSEILNLIVPQGWFLPVTPGTQFITLGGAIANDVHGKNHHRRGTFGCHVNRLELLRSDGERLICSRSENTGWFNATIGGLGLTGLITWCEVQMVPIQGPFIEQELIQYKTLDEFFELSERSDSSWEYTVAWIDCLARKDQLGRGVFTRGNYAQAAATSRKANRGMTTNFPVELPFSPLNHWTIKAFNTFYYYNPRRKQGVHSVHYEAFFYPLDKVRNWNRVYGSKGLLQFQCVIPLCGAEETIKNILLTISRSDSGSPLAVLKKFGNRRSPGLLSFPREGVTLALDFSNRGRVTSQLFDELTVLVREAHGAIYPAKDAHMSADDFHCFFPQWKKLTDYVDPAFRSSFWGRVGGAGL